MAAGPARPGLEVLNLNFPFAQGAGARTSQVSVSNLGGGPLPFRVTAATNTGGNWLSVTPDSGNATAAAPGAIAVSANPRGLGIGTYTGRVTVEGAGQTIEAPVTMTISALSQSIVLSQTGLTFTAVAQGGAVPPQSLGILNAGQGVMDWTVNASTLSGGSGWLTATPAGGSTDAASLVVPVVNVGINAAGLDAGEYYGQVEVSSPTADNSPQVAAIVLQVLPPGSDPGPVVRPTGLIFAGIAGAANPAAQTVLVSNVTAAGRTFASGRLTTDGRLWFSSTPVGATIGSGQTATITVQTDITGLTPGIRRGVLTILFADGTVRTVNVLLVLIAGPGSSAFSLRTANGCTPARLLPVFTLLGDQFSVASSWPTPIEVRVADDCGNATTSGAVIASFSNGDPPLPMVSLKDGRWSGTWQARNTRTAMVAVTVTAEAGGGVRGTAQVTGGLRSNTTPPAVSPGGLAEILSPGGIVSIFGARLAEGQPASGSLPLPVQLGGATVVLGGKTLPLYYASEGQINAQVPFDVPVNVRQQLLIRRGASSTVPETVTLAPGFTGLYQVNAVLPEGVAAGDAAPVVLTVAAKPAGQSPWPCGEASSAGRGGAVPAYMPSPPDSIRPLSTPRA